jgi:hypothetical protein
MGNDSPYLHDSCPVTPNKPFDGDSDLSSIYSNTWFPIKLVLMLTVSKMVEEGVGKEEEE